MNLSGTWTGRYWYDSAGGPESVTFTLQLKHSWLVRIAGTVQDGPHGMPEAGKVVGWLFGKKLRFRKMMPVFRVAAEGGTMPLVEYLAASGDLRIQPNTPHPPILYTGSVQADTASVSGIWSVSQSIVPLDGQAKALRFPGYTGSWQARRGECAEPQNKTLQQSRHVDGSRPSGPWRRQCVPRS